MTQTLALPVRASVNTDLNVRLAPGDGRPARFLYSRAVKINT
jgi:hypothetical protein